MKLLFVVIFLFANIKCSAKEHFNTEFLSNSCIKPLIEYHYLTCNDIVLKVNGILFTIPLGFETDLASIPQIAWPILAPAHSSLIRPAIVHDWMYRTACYFTRKQSDLIFYHLLVNEGISRFRASIMYYAVRLFGWNYFEENYCGDQMDQRTRKSQLAFLEKYGQ